MKTTLFATVAAVAIAFSAPSMAQDMGSSPLTGAYIGLLGGYTNTELEAGGASEDLTGGDYGIFAGFKLDKYLENSIGITGAIEAHYAWSTADEEIGGITLEKDSEFGISFRPGISISERFNPYGIIGYKRTEFDASGFGLSASEDYNGVELGLGAEVLSYGNIGFRLEYAHTWYDEDDGLDVDEDTIRAGVSYNF